MYKDHFVYAPSHWEMALQYNVVSHWQGAYTKWSLELVWHTWCTISYGRPGASPTNDISIEFEIRPKFGVLWFKMHIADLNDILSTSRQCSYRAVRKLSVWSVENILN